MSPVETITFASGSTAYIYHDAYVGNPFRHDDSLRIVVLHRRYIDPSDGDCGRDADEVTAWERENADEWFTIPLFLYDHSGTVYRAPRSNPFHCRWDSGRVGIIALKRSNWGNGNESDERLAEYAQGIADDYTNWANGECYGYVLSDRAGRELDSCWGFIGIERVRKEAAAAADAIRCVRGNVAPANVWLLHVSHRHGDNYAAFTSLEAARRGLHGYVTDWWDDGLTEQYGALDSLSPDDAIDAYFDAYGEAIDPEFYVLEEVTLDATDL